MGDSCGLHTCSLRFLNGLGVQSESGLDRTISLAKKNQHNHVSTVTPTVTGTAKPPPRSNGSKCGHEEVSSRSMYIGSKDETFNELEPKLVMVSVVPVTVEVTVETWLSGFLLTEDYSEEQALKGISQ
ncbi:hypothetical protein YC2023_032401 [Brassica napus]